MALSVKSEFQRFRQPFFWLRIFAFSLIFAFAAQSYWVIGRQVIQTNHIEALTQIFSIHIRPLLSAFLFCVLVSPFVFLYWRRIMDWIYKYRYALGLLLLVTCVVFKISGSSISVWDSYLPQGGDFSGETLFGMPRMVRSDEWATNTPFAFSQYNNSSGAFAYFSDTIRGTATDTYIVYGQPVWDIAVLFRPFHWGYLFLSQERGLSFFWCARLISLVLVSFEMGMLITGKNKLLSFAMAVLVAFAPTVQWWFAINGLVEMLVFGQLAILLVHRYMTDGRYSRRLLYCLALVICGGGYILTFYPSWEVSLAYIFLALLIWVVWEHRKAFSFRAGRDIPIFLLFFLLLGGGMAYIYTRSADTISAVMHTVYPGSRLETGGGCFLNMFLYVGNLLFPFTNLGIPGNTCEMSAFFDFAPVGVILAVLVLIKQRDRLLICLLACEAFLVSYITFGFPETIAKLTLLSNCQPLRICEIIGFLNILILIRSLSLFNGKVKPAVAALAGILLSAGIMAVSYGFYGDYLGAYKLFMFAGLGVVAAVLFTMLFLAGRQTVRRAFSLIAAALVFFSGMLVNPVQAGCSDVFESPAYQRIEEIASGSGGLWLVNELPYPIINLPVMAGAPTVNSTNVYPALDRWGMLDPEGDYSDVYNRYAHILAEVQADSPTWFELNGADMFCLHIHVDDLQKLGVGYILSTAGALEPLSDEGVWFEELERFDRFSIYKVSYAEE